MLFVSVIFLVRLDQLQVWRHRVRYKRLKKTLYVTCKIIIIQYSKKCKEDWIGIGHSTIMPLTYRWYWPIGDYSDISFAKQSKYSHQAPEFLIHLDGQEGNTLHSMWLSGSAFKNRFLVFAVHWSSLSIRRLEGWAAFGHWNLERLFETGEEAK